MKNENILLFRGNEFDANFYYHTGMDVDNSFYLKTGGKEILLVPRLNERAAKESFRGKVIAYKKPMEGLAALAKGKTLLLDYSSLPAKIYASVRKFAKTRDASEELFSLRAKKRPEEVEKIRKAVSSTKKILSGFQNEDFRNEAEAANWLLVQTFAKGLRPAFDPIVGSGRHSAFPHYKPAQAKMGNFCLVDYGVRHENYCSDLTRVFFTRREKKAEAAYEKMKTIFHEIMDAFPDFETGKDVAEFSEKLFRKYRLPEPIHSIGHGVGLDIHEFPRLNKKYADPLKGAVLAIEPAAYFRNFGVRYEETVYFDGKRARVL